MTTINKEKLESFKKELIARKDLLLNGLLETNAEFINDEPIFADTVDQASVETDKTLALQIKNRNAVIVGEIDEALKRIEQGGFGECESCGGEITMARMKASPASTLCVECKSELEYEQTRFSRNQ